MELDIFYVKKENISFEVCFNILLLYLIAKDRIYSENQTRYIRWSWIWISVLKRSYTKEKCRYVIIFILLQRINFWFSIFGIVISSANGNLCLLSCLRVIWRGHVFK